jgi:hypothetical protein
MNIAACGFTLSPGSDANPSRRKIRRRVADVRQASGTLLARLVRVLHFQTRLLRRAAEIAGDAPALAASLGVAEESLGIWMNGKAKMPDAVFLAAADLVLEDDIARAAHDRRHEPRTFGAVHR